MKVNRFFLGSIVLILICLVLGCEARIKNDHIYDVNEFNNKTKRSEVTSNADTGAFDSKKGTNNLEQDFSVDSESQNTFTTMEFVDGNTYQKVKSKLQSISENTDIKIITISPDLEEVFTFEPQGKEKMPEQSTIYGGTYSKILLVKYNLKTGTRKILGYNIPFIALTKWSHNGSKVAFLGGGVLSVYDREKEVYISNIEGNRAGVRYFGWNPDKDILYTEHDYSPTGSIYYTQTQELVYNYEIDDNLFFKGLLNNDYQYATFSKYYDEEDGKKTGITQEYWTVITDNKGNIIKQISKGRFRDSYKNSVIYVGDNGFELYLIQDIHKFNSVSEPIQLSDKYIYDAKFDVNGNIIFVAAEHDQSSTGKLINISNNTGNIEIGIETEYSEILLTPDGKGVYIVENNAYKVYGIDSLKNTVTSKSGSFNAQTYGIIEVNADFENYYDTEVAYHTVIEAVKTYAKWHMLGEGDVEAANACFTNTEEPALWALYETMLLFNETIPVSTNAKQYAVTIDVGKCDFYSEDRAQIEVTASMSNSYGTGMGVQENYEMIKLNGSWYVTGIATFSRSSQTKQVRQIVGKELKRILNETSEQIFSVDNIQIGQIQFWQMSEPHHASKVEYSNYCKVFLRVGKENIIDNNSVIYKIVLKKDEKNGWLFQDISNTNLYGL